MQILSSIPASTWITDIPFSLTPNVPCFLKQLYAPFLMILCSYLTTLLGDVLLHRFCIRITWFIDKENKAQDAFIQVHVCPERWGSESFPPVFLPFESWTMGLWVVSSRFPPLWVLNDGLWVVSSRFPPLWVLNDGALSRFLPCSSPLSPERWGSESFPPVFLPFESWTMGLWVVSSRFPPLWVLNDGALSRFLPFSSPLSPERWGSESFPPVFLPFESWTMGLWVVSSRFPPLWVLNDGALSRFLSFSSPLSPERWGSESFPPVFLPFESWTMGLWVVSSRFPPLWVLNDGALSRFLPCSSPLRSRWMFENTWEVFKEFLDTRKQFFEFQWRF